VAAQQVDANQRVALMRIKYWAPLLAALVGLLVAINYPWPRSSAMGQPLPQTLAADSTMLPLQAPVTRTFPIELEGEAVAEQSMTLRAPVDGVLLRLSSPVDDTVMQGQELAFVDSAELTQKLLENESKVEELSATVLLYSPTTSPDLRKLQAALDGGRQKYRYAEASFEKVEELFRRGLISGKERADAGVQLQAGKLELAAAEREYADARSLGSATYLKIRNQLQVAQIEQAQLLKTKASLSIRAPFAGQVRRYAPPRHHPADIWAVGDTVKAAEALFHIESRSRVITVDISPQLLRHFAVGDAVTVISKGQQALSFPATVQTIIRAPYEEGPAALGEAVAQIRVVVKEPAFASAEHRKVTVSKAVPQQGVAVPVALVLDEGGERFVYVKPCAQNGAPFARRRVVLSAEQDGTVLITAGVVEGECVADVSGAGSWGR
jgi:multidrug resistance efflux pump